MKITSPSPSLIFLSAPSGYGFYVYYPETGLLRSFARVKTSYVNDLGSPYELTSSDVLGILSAMDEHEHEVLPGKSRGTSELRVYGLLSSYMRSLCV